jgi:hypothetical protein
MVKNKNVVGKKAPTRKNVNKVPTEKAKITKEKGLEPLKKQPSRKAKTNKPIVIPKQKTTNKKKPVKKQKKEEEEDKMEDDDDSIVKQQVEEKQIKQNINEETQLESNLIST